MFAIESERSGKIRSSSVSKRLQIVSARRLDSLEFDKSTILVLVNHGMGLKACDFVKIVRNSEIQCTADDKVMYLQKRKVNKAMNQ